MEELTLLISDETLRKIKALAQLKGVDHKFISSLIERNIDQIITKSILEELDLSEESFSNTFRSDLNEASIDKSASFEDDLDDEMSEDDTGLMPSFSHGLSEEDEGAIDQTPNPLLEMEDDVPPKENARGATPMSASQSFSSLIDENIASSGRVTDDPEDYMEEVIDTATAVDATLAKTRGRSGGTSTDSLLQDEGGSREAVSHFRGPKVKVSEHTVGHA